MLIIIILNLKTRFREKSIFRDHNFQRKSDRLFFFKVPSYKREKTRN